MANADPPPPPKNPPESRWGFFAGISALLSSAFANATNAQKAAILAMGLGAAMFTGLGLVGSVTLPAWAIVAMFSLVTLLVFGMAGLLLHIERGAATSIPCRHVPVYPLAAATCAKFKAALEEIRRDLFLQLQSRYPSLPDTDIRANIFVLAEIVGGATDGMWKLVIHPGLNINIDDLNERQLQLSIGQGATGVAYRDGDYQLTRRLTPPANGNWEQSFQLTPELVAQIHPRLQWILTFPLLRPNTKETVGVLNIDGLTDVADDDLLKKVASGLQDQVNVIAEHLSLQRSICVGIDRLGVMKRA